MLIPPFLQSACLLRDPRLPHLPLSASLAHTHTRCTLQQEDDEKSARRAVALLRLLPAAVSVPVIQPVLSPARASTVCGGRSAGAALESDLIAALAFCQQRLPSDEHNGSSGQSDLLLSVSLGQAECDGSGALFSLSAAAMASSGTSPLSGPPRQVNSGVLSQPRCKKPCRKKSGEGDCAAAS